MPSEQNSPGYEHEVETNDREPSRHSSHDIIEYNGPRSIFKPLHTIISCRSGPNLKGLSWPEVRREAIDDRKNSDNDNDNDSP